MVDMEWDAGVPLDVNAFADTAIRSCRNSELKPEEDCAKELGSLMARTGSQQDIHQRSVASYVIYEGHVHQ